MSATPSLEPEALALIRASAKPPFLFQLGPEKGRKAVQEAQAEFSQDVGPPVDFEDRSLPVGPSGKVHVRVLKPKFAPALLPVILYVHGAGWVFGDASTHHRLVCELAVGAKAAVVFPTYSLSPEARFPTAIEEVYAVALWIAKEGPSLGLDPARLVIAGDSVGGNMAAAVTLLAKQRGAPAIQRQLLFYPVTDASFSTASYEQFAEGYFLRRDAMQWFWDQYLLDPKARLQITASPLQASLEELKGLPEALVITAEADVLRDEGEAYAAKLREAGVRVTAARFQGIIHDFVMLNAMAGTAAARGAMGLAQAWLRQGWET